MSFDNKRNKAISIGRIVYRKPSASVLLKDNVLNIDCMIYKPFASVLLSENVLIIGNSLVSPEQ